MNKIKINQTVKQVGHHIVILKSRDKVEGGKVMIFLLHMKLLLRKDNELIKSWEFFH